MRLTVGLAFCAALATAALPAAAQTLKVGVSAPVTSIDPHYHNLSPNNTLASQIFDALTEIDPKGHLQPDLATSWKLVAPDTWEFKLRDAKFQDGTPFTAQDVAFTIDRVPHVPNSPSSFSAYVKPITSIEIVDAHTIRLHTQTVAPLLPTYLAQVYIISHTAAAGASTADFNSGKAAIGTGPFKFVSFKPGDRIELVRNELYWGQKPYWKNVDYRMIPNDGARTAALLAGDVDFIDFVPTVDMARLRKDKRVRLWEALGTRIIFLGMNQSTDGPIPGLTGPNGEKLSKNPLKDLRVRQALSEAINRKAIADRLMEGAAQPSGQFLPPGTFGYVPGLKPPPYDPAAAKKLLAAAGFPHGFSIVLAGPNNRYVNDSEIIQAVGQMWQRIGVKTSVQPLPWTSYVGRAGKQEFPAFLFGWGTATVEPSDPLIAQVATFDKAKGHGAANRGRYSNPKLDALIEQAVATSDDAQREKLLQQATMMAMDEVAIIPLHIQENVWATRAGLTYVPGVDERLRLNDVRPAK